ncbi:unnamed protein product [Bursaphelenchus xylophilus]|uniref:(pine wood nematode) hypothetical protein n=1 Tax=Bursaphelenchus xylophilus TaxID=6326 RepID=A0A7I8XCL8_BURXY|nr:unnamed protein product [Bursaphelenchus xylophilus]CAG9083979.1 unnamed protein product [Bursaphelenchus xylophilus]
MGEPGTTSESASLDLQTPLPNGNTVVEEGEKSEEQESPQAETSELASPESQVNVPAVQIPTNPEDLARLKRSYVIKELVETEQDYVKDLTSVVEGYIANLESMELPEDLRGKDKIIFANIGQILDFHKTVFLRDIEKSANDYEAAGQAFIKHERRLHTYYVKYCQNKPKSDFLVSQESFEQFFAETKQRLGHRVALCDLLIKPVQRIMKYQLMLKDILKYTEKSGERADVLKRALDVMHVVPKACDDMMQVGRLQNFEGSLSAQGRLIFQGKLSISDGGATQPFKGKPRRVFLFEQSAIIADEIQPKKEFGNPTYIFKNQIMVNKMVLQENIPDEPLRFGLSSNDPVQQVKFVAEAENAEDRENWLQKISAQLDQQKTFLAALVDPKKYQNQLASNMANTSISDNKKSNNSHPAVASTSSNSNSHSNSPLRPGSGTASKSSKLFSFVSVLSGKSK